jgi:hypothetical protein
LVDAVLPGLAQQGLKKKPDEASKILEARLRAQIVQAGIESEEWSRKRTFSVRPLEIVDGLFFLAQAGVDNRQLVGEM